MCPFYSATNKIPRYDQYEDKDNTYFLQQNLILQQSQIERAMHTKKGLSQNARCNEAVLTVKSQLIHVMHAVMKLSWTVKSQLIHVMHAVMNLSWTVQSDGTSSKKVT